MAKFKQGEIKSFLDYKADLYENENFIEDDPISIPHLFSKKEDIEISAFLTATISWGQRKTIINWDTDKTIFTNISFFSYTNQTSKH